MRFLSLSVLILIGVFTACADRDADEAVAAQATADAERRPAANAAPPVLTADPLAAGNADDVETLRTRLDEYDLRAAQLRERLDESGLDTSPEVRESLGALAVYREQAEEQLGELETRTGSAFAALEEEVELMITDLGRNLDATARGLEIELEPVERTASLAPTTEEEREAAEAAPAAQATPPAQAAPANPTTPAAATPQAEIATRVSEAPETTEDDRG